VPGEAVPRSDHARSTPLTRIVCAAVAWVIPSV
jgi:hypothetical protein